jgi:hypothetical protein
MERQAWAGIRTARQSISHPMTINSYFTDFCLFLIRTLWKLTHLFSSASIDNCLKIIVKNKFYGIPSGNSGIFTPNRTSWKLNSYSTANFLSFNRTPRKSIRTAWKAVTEIIGEKGLKRLSISKSLYISKGMKNND